MKAYKWKTLQKQIGKKRNAKYSVPLRYKEVNWEKVESIFQNDRVFLAHKTDWSHQGKAFTTKDFLKLLAAGTVFALALTVAPTIPLAIAPFLEDPREYNRKHWRQSIDRLRRQKLVEIVYEGDQTVVKITKEGRFRALRYKLADMGVAPQKRWDGRWRVVVFDIPEKYKQMREIFRENLKTMHFYPLQKSVWVHAYPCFDEIEFLRQVYHVGVDVTFMEVARLEDDTALRSFFEIA